MATTSRDLHYMRAALRLAAKGRGTTSPNPMVGALVLNRGRIVGRGFHLRPGLPHAEILALNQAGKRARGATLYVTLEPCCHRNKRTPPCVPAVLQSGVRRVVVAMTDPNPAVRGRGLAALRRGGLRVQSGVAAEMAEALNKAYCHWVTMKRPFVTLKAGMTLDGQIATASGESRWITGMRARRDVHTLRAQTDAVMTGIGTVLTDDPSLNARTGPQLDRPAARQPLRVVVDSRLRIPERARVLSQQRVAKTLLATTVSASSAKRRSLERRGIETVVLPAAEGRVSLPALMKELGRRGVTSVLLEGGGELNAAMLRAKLVDRVRFYIAPTLLGGTNAKGVIGGRCPARLAQAMKLRDMRIQRYDGDLLVEGDL
ncbi:MAG TPA: bifunctional diaminohydroxyphosphoribosylaminopyrimidine deaminase/5-amino-6-(5-phosphoribosylamino)uracil reductase RibD [Nitrospira sp.]|nr:bifunctional diaminohydroxyphosphoribosylaminopyrimidine deaminase/5-amino-6-(5-phosphoribosylamino)uracil reductase RibD [Nitrospira sp.]